MKVDESGWKGMKVDKDGWKSLKMHASRAKWMEIYERMERMDENW